MKHVEKGLAGVIKGCGILCFCETCGGKEVSVLLLHTCCYLIALKAMRGLFGF